MSVAGDRKQGQRIPDEIRAKILAADISISHCQLSYQLGVTDVSVRNIRVAAGIHRTREMGQASAAESRKAHRNASGSLNKEGIIGAL